MYKRKGTPLTTGGGGGRSGSSGGGNNGKGHKNSPSSETSSPSPGGLFRLRAAVDYNTPTYPSIGLTGHMQSRYINFGSGMLTKGSNGGPAAAAAATDEGANAEEAAADVKKEPGMFDCMPTRTFEEAVTAAEIGLDPFGSDLYGDNTGNNSSSSSSSSSSSISSSGKTDGDSGDGSEEQIVQWRERGLRRYTFEFYGDDVEALKKFVESKEIRPQSVQPGQAPDAIRCMYLLEDDVERDRKLKEITRCTKTDTGKIIGVRQVGGEEIVGRSSSSSLAAAAAAAASTSVFAGNSGFYGGSTLYRAGACSAGSSDGRSMWDFGILSYVLAWLWDFIETFFGW